MITGAGACTSFLLGSLTRVRGSRKRVASAHALPSEPPGSVDWPSDYSLLLCSLCLSITPFKSMIPLSLLINGTAIPNVLERDG